MDYLLVSKMNQFYQWQNELLIESFLNSQSINSLKLCIYADSASLNSRYFTNTLQINLPIFNMPDHGFEFGYGKANIFYSARNLINNNLISSSFTILESDVVLHKELKKECETEFPSILFSKNVNFDYKNFIKEIPNFCDIFEVTEDFLSQSWPYIGGVVVFNKFDGAFFDFIMEHIAKSAILQQNLNGTIHEKTYKIMLAVMIMKNKEKIYSQYIDYGETNMLDNNTNFHFVHYQKGLPPHFHKFMFKNFQLAYGDPFDVIRMNPSTYASFVMHEFAGKYLKKIGRKLEPIVMV